MRKIILSLILSTGCLLLKAQVAADSIPEPEFINQVFVLGKDYKLRDLEKKDAEVVNKSKVAGMGGGKQVYQLEGGKSAVILPADNKMFVIGTSGGGGFGMDPSSQFSLYKFESKKNKRESTVMEYGGMMNKGKTKDNPNEIRLNFKKLKEGVFGMIPEKPLEKGEYAFINKMSMQGGGISMKMDAFAFSIE
jgi:hypothetical protein